LNVEKEGGIDMMMEIRFKMDSSYIENMKKALGKNRTSDIVQEAFDLLSWAVESVSKGYCIGSFDANSMPIERIITPGLTDLRNNNLQF
jgi:hypothetical protein